MHRRCGRTQRWRTSADRRTGRLLVGRSTDRSSRDRAGAHGRATEIVSAERSPRKAQDSPGARRRERRGHSGADRPVVHRNRSSGCGSRSASAPTAARRSRSLRDDETALARRGPPRQDRPGDARRGLRHASVATDRPGRGRRRLPPRQSAAKNSRRTPDPEIEPDPRHPCRLGATPRPQGRGILAASPQRTADPHDSLVAEERGARARRLVVATTSAVPESVRGPTNRAVLAGADGVTDVGLVTKRDLAGAVVDKIVELLRR